MQIVASTKIYQWQEVRQDFRRADILLGNGFSININPTLAYHSLFEHFTARLESTHQAAFSKLNTTNFEVLQTRLLDAIGVNDTFGINSGALIDALGKLKTGLIDVIGNLHPPYSLVKQSLIFELSQKLDWFRDVYTTNYDTFLYHISLTTLDRHRKDNHVQPYQDFFTRSDDGLIFESKSFSSHKGIYYLHGALFLFKKSRLVTKLVRGTNRTELIDLIRDRIVAGSFPLFVSEGSSRLKTHTIENDSYLSFCRKAFCKSRNPLVIHGFSFSKSDGHLTNDLINNQRPLAIGLFLRNLTKMEIQRRLRHIEKQIYGFERKDFLFFESNSLF
jgi:hypothetical protein